MNILKRWRGHEQDDRNVSVRHGERGLSRLSDLRDVRERMNRAFEEMWHRLEHDPWSALTTPDESFGGLANWPAVDLAEDEKALTLRVDVPGLDEKDLDIEVSGNLLTIRGSRNDEWEDKKRGVRRRERVSGSFARTLTLPAYAQTDKIDAKYAKGTLTITVPKAPGHGPRRVPLIAE